MNHYTISSLIGFILVGMGIIALLLGYFNLKENRESNRGRLMFEICICVFFWNFGYAWMSLSYYDDLAYVFRAVSLLAVTFYMFSIIRYVTAITKYPARTSNIFLLFFMIASLISWYFIIQKNAVSFVQVAWGYWYISRMSFARILQFASIIAALIYYYVILQTSIKKATLNRDKYIYSRFKWFGPILFTGYIFDTLFPSIFNIPAIPGSCISAFCSAMLLYHISKNNKSFGVSKDNVSEYVFQDVSIPVLIENRQGKIILVNHFTKNYFHCMEQDIVNHEFHEFFEHAPEIEEEKDLNDDDFIQLVKVKGKENVCKLSKSVVNDQFGDLLYTIYFVQDVTKERNTLQMLSESRQQAEEASKAKSNFLANMSHEIRTPMNAIIGMSEIILQDDTISESTRTQTREIETAGSSLLGIINDILDISKIEAGKYELIDDEYEIGSLLHDVSNIIQVRVQESKVKYVLELDETIPRKMIGDITRIRQVLLNILGNAAKFTKQGSITLKVFWDHCIEHPKICFDVIDTGIGMKPEDKDKIFGIFTQVDTRKNRNIKGTGLGLSISKNLSQLMGGDITVDSVYGEGSTFHIVIYQNLKEYKPLGSELAASLTAGKYVGDESAKQIEIIKRPDCRVLVVDDNAVNLRVASGLMKRYELQIDTALSGREAIEKVQEKPYDIVFMDHMMPEMDGIDTSKEIRAMENGKYKDLIIVALTANALTEAKDLFLKEGLQDFLAKPIDRKALDMILKKWLPGK